MINIYDTYCSKCEHRHLSCGEDPCYKCIVIWYGGLPNVCKPIHYQVDPWFLSLEKEENKND